MAHDYVIIDLETTGLDTSRDEIIEIAAVKVRRGLIVDSFSTLVSCPHELPEEITRLTGISTEMLEGQPSIAQAVDMLEQFAGAAELAAHNADFDSGMLRRFWPDQRQWLDTITLAQIAFPCATSFKLSNLTSWLGINLTQAHRALGDALATAELFIRVEKELDKLPPAAKEDILLLAEGDNTPTGELLRHKCKAVGESASPAEQEAKWDKSKREADDDYRLDPERITALLGEDNSSQQRIDDFEQRPQQLSMSLSVCECLNDGGALLVEAGTGTGKSLAYLLPAALYAQGSGGQVIISTHTRNLQEQLLHKDIPLLSQLLDQPVRAAVVKGRSNYICRRMYKYLLHNVPENMRYFLMRVAVWRSRSSSGDGSELNLTSYDRWRWQRVCAAKENCAPFCPYSRRNGCQVQQVRARATQADIVIVNHSLLVINSIMDNSILPPISRIIIDEAQHIEDAAEDQLTSRLDVYEVLNLLGRLLRREKGQLTGAIPSLRRQLNKQPQSVADQADPLLSSLEADTDNLIRVAEAFFELINQFLRPKGSSDAFFPAQERILPHHREADSWPLIDEQGQALCAEFIKLAKDCFRLLDLLGGDEQEERPPGCEELFSVGSLSRELGETLATWLSGEDDNFVNWVEFPDKDKKPALMMAPVEIGAILSEHLYAEARSLIFTSATLSISRDFGYFKQRLGLDLYEPPLRELSLASPFFYRDQALFTVVNDLPDWSKCGAIEAAAAVSSALTQLIPASGGRAIVLFTSHQQLKAVYQQLQEPLRAQGITLLAHGVSGDPSSLLERLKKEERCCILGANSFWEGVDVIGSALSLIVVVRLPFWPPNTPLAQSRMERIEAAGGNSFYDFSLLQALVRFKQGFGRLIRSQSDSGVFCVLDRRIVEKNYGKRFIKCLPEMRRQVGDSAEIARIIQDWLQ